MLDQSVSASQRAIHPPLLLGCCGWAGSQSKYFSHFPAIELQSTFYDPPAAKIALRWRDVAPADFVFCIKAWQLITHPASSPTYRRLRAPIKAEHRDHVGLFQDTPEVWDAWTKTHEIAEALRAAVVLFQCPASFRPTSGNVQNLRQFFQKLGPQPFRIAWEPRGPWPSDLIRDLCAEYSLIHCVDPLMNRSVYGSIYWRLHGRGSYSYRYTDEDLAELKMQFLTTEARNPAYILFNNVTMKDDALRFAQLLALE